MDYQCPPSQAEHPPSSVGAPALKKVKKRAPQRNVDEFWDKFTTKFPGKIYSILPANVYAKTKAAQSPSGLIHGRAIGKSYDEAAADCRAAVESISRECRRVNLKYRDPHFDIEFDLKRNRRDCLDSLNGSGSDLTPKSVKRVPDIFDEPVFFKEGATANDVRQGFNGDCWFLSALCAISNKKNLVDRVCVHRDEKVGVYGFVFHRDGEWIQTIIDDKLYLIAADWYESTDDKRTWEDVRRSDPEEEYRKANQTGSRSLCFAQCSDQNETWLPLLEKAFAKAHGDYSSIDGGFTGEAIEDLTGGVTTELLTTDILDTDQFWSEQLLKVNDEFLFGCATGRFDKWQGSMDGDATVHAYSVQQAVEMKGERLLRIRNPWGDTEWQGPWSDGSEQWTPEWMDLLGHRFGDDGMFWISYKDFLRKYQSLDRTRLFGPEWQVTQQWTTLNVPWSADYNDTKFSLTVSQPGPVVLVLSQLDSRYFRGLEGQYTFQLHFRLEKEGDEEFMVRSHSNYSMSRSVSTDVELEPGTYSVLMKITAKRWTGDRTPDEIVRDSCMGRPEKLIQVGLTYDLAHAKGEIRETEKEKKSRELREKKKKEAEHQKRRGDLRAEMLRNWEAGKKRAARIKRQAKRKEEYFKKKASAAKAAEAAQKEPSPGETEVAAEASVEAASDDKDQTPQAGSEPEAIEIPDSKPTAPPSPPPETAQEGDDEAGWVDEDEANAAEGKADEKLNDEGPINDSNAQDDPPATDDVGAAPGNEDTEAAGVDEGVDEEPPAEAEEDDDWEYASDASFQSSIVTELDLPPLSDEAPDAAPEEDNETDEANAEFEDDPWNAVCVVGLKVYSKDKGLCVETVRPKQDLDEGESPLDVDDASKGQSVERVEEPKAE
ncbi:MAG: hypothetical protein Q9222_001439 [Ikaeria aurantiellina]